MRYSIVAGIVLSAACPAAMAIPSVIGGPQYYGGHTYYKLETANWTDSEAAAVQLGGHLATINNAAENAWVWSTLGAHGTALWIGYTNVTPDHSWRWVDGSTSTYTNWDPIEPNDSVSYAMIWDGSSWPDWPPCNGQPPGQWVDMYDWSAVPSPTYAPVTTPIYGVVEVVPEPASVVLLLGGVSVIGCRRKRLGVFRTL